MPTRWVIRERRLEDVDTTRLMQTLADDVADDMRRLVPVDKGFLRGGIRIKSVTKNRATIITDRPPGGGGVGRNQKQYVEEVPYFVEYGTAHSRAQPYIRPAVYRRRSA